MLLLCFRNCMPNHQIIDDLKEASLHMKAQTYGLNKICANDCIFRVNVLLSSKAQVTYALEV
jgi:hypothetical protein